MVSLIDREVFFGNPEISGGQISPDGRTISFIKPLKGVRNIWVKRFDQLFEEAVPITEDQHRPIQSYFWSRDSKNVLYVQDKGGDENFHVFAVDPYEPIAEGQQVPASRDLTPYKGIRAYIMKVPKSKPSKIFVGLNDRDPAWHDLYEIDMASGERSLIIKNEIQLSAIYFDLDDQLRLATRSKKDGGTEILKFINGEFKMCLECSHEEMLSPIRFKDKGHAYLATNLGSEDLVALALINLSTDELTYVERDPKGEVDLGGTSFSEVTDLLIATSYVGDKTRIYWKDQNFKEDYEFLKKELKTEEVSFTSGTKDETRWVVYANSDTDPGAAYVFERGSRELTFLYRPRPNLPTDLLCKMKPVKYKSLDGLIIPAYLTLPKSLEPKGLPAVVLVHGGPWARDHWGYHSFAQFLANRGYAVLQPNFRGSTGFGKKFLNAGNGEWGEKMQDDITAGARYLVEKNISPADKIGIMGGSYGGYAALAGLTFTPEVYACGISIVGPSNLFTLLESIPPYWETVRELFHIRMGNPNTKEGKEALRQKSPYFHADNILAPLLVGQGNNDPRVKTAESDQIVTAMRDHKRPVEYLNFPDEGHGFANPKNNMAFLTVTEKFLAEHLDGRYQEDVPEDLKEIILKVTVDIEKL